jgi:PAS domain S-box-containing protein
MLAIESVLQAVLSVEDDAITVINRNKDVLYWNKAAEDTYHIPKNKIIHKSITDFFKKEDLMVLQVLDSKESVKNIYHRPRADKHVVINAAPIFNEQGELVGAVSAERDITQVVRLNANLETTSQELNELRMQVKQTNKTSPFSKLIGKSSSLLETIQIAKKASQTDATTLILGDSGTGKEVCARAIHEASARNEHPFIAVNCGAIPPALFESEIFGYEKGSFTGALEEGKAGKIELAHEGTLFLDEIGELPLDMQVKLLRVLQENRLYRIGDSTGREIDVRIIAATNQDLEKMLQEKQFRSDLYYRLNVIQVTMPPLNNRTEDIPELAQAFLKQAALKYQSPVPTIDERAIYYLLAYDWPGNVRELKNMMERLVILIDKPVITENDLLKLFPNLESATTSDNESPLTLSDEKQSMEQTMIETALKQANGNKSDAARRLGISRVTLYNKLKKYGIHS